MAGTTLRMTDGPMLVLVWVNVRPGGLTQGAMAAPSGGVETRLQAGLALERGLCQRRANLDPLLPVADSSHRRNTGDVMVGDATD